jgi:hypothetical protein
MRNTKKSTRRIAAGLCGSLPVLVLVFLLRTEAQTVPTGKSNAGVAPASAAKPASVVPNQSSKAAGGSTTQRSASCHDLIVQAAAVRVEWDANAPDLEKELSANQQRLSVWMNQLDECVSQHPEQLSTDDWQKVVFVYARMQREFDADFEARVATSSAEASGDQQNKKVRDQDQQSLNDYNALVHKYNDLVRDYNNQRDLILRLIATPPPLAPARTFVHCSTFNFGTIGSVDCY